MDIKKFRHFLCGFLCGAGIVYWYTFAAEETLERALSWLENAANEYRATHEGPKVDTGWKSHGKNEEQNGKNEEQNRL